MDLRKKKAWDNVNDHERNDDEMVIAMLHPLTRHSVHEQASTESSTNSRTNHPNEMPSTNTSYCDKKISNLKSLLLLYTACTRHDSTNHPIKETG